MAHNEIRVNNSREGNAVDNLVKSLDDLGGCKFRFPPEALAKGFRELIAAEEKDFAEARQEKGLPLNYTLDSDEQKLYEERLTQCAWQHFNEQSPEKLRVTLAELIHESLCFAESIYGERIGASEEQINEARPSLEILHQNVLRRSILRLRKLQYRGSSEEADKNNAALFPLNRAHEEIFNHLAFWTYDHDLVRRLFKETILLKVKDQSYADEKAGFFANEAAEIVWDNIDGGMEAASKMLVMFAYQLSEVSAVQRHEHLIPPNEAKEYGITLSELEDIAKLSLKPWLKNLSVKLKGRGGSDPVVDLTDEDLISFAQKYKELLPIIQDACSLYKSELNEGYWDQAVEGDGSPIDSVRERFKEQLSDEVIKQIDSKLPEDIALFEAARDSKLQGYKKRSLETFRAHGNALLANSPQTKKTK